MSKHTPGPWTLAAQDTAVFAPTLAKPLAWRLSKANARLIAAAPELLAALEELAQRLQVGCKTAAERGEAVLIASRAIAKAAT